MVFVHPEGRCQMPVTHPFLWAMLLGPLYFAAHGAWVHAVLAAVLVVPTGGVSWLLYPFLAGAILRHRYRRSGWIEIAEPEGVPAGEILARANVTLGNLLAAALFYLLLFFACFFGLLLPLEAYLGETAGTIGGFAGLTLFVYLVRAIRRRRARGARN